MGSQKSKNLAGIFLFTKKKRWSSFFRFLDSQLQFLLCWEQVEFCQYLFCNIKGKFSDIFKRLESGQLGCGALGDFPTAELLDKCWRWLKIVTEHVGSFDFSPLWCNINLSSKIKVLFFYNMSDWIIQNIGEKWWG